MAAQPDKASDPAQLLKKLKVKNPDAYRHIVWLIRQLLTFVK